MTWDRGICSFSGVGPRPSLGLARNELADFWCLGLFVYKLLTCLKLNVIYFDYFHMNLHLIKFLLLFHSECEGVTLPNPYSIPG